MDLGYVSGHRLRADLVTQAAAMIAAAARDGVALRITQAYRSYEEQVALFRARYSPRPTGAGPYGDVRWWDGVRYVRTSGAAAAVPGTSTHGKGQAIDFATDSPGAIAWLTRNGAKYGWARPAWTFRAPTIEPWHWEAVYVLVSNPIGGGGGSIPSVPNLPPLTPIEEIDMPLTPDEIEAVATAVWAHALKRPNGPPADAGTYLVDSRVLLGNPAAPLELVADQVWKAALPKAVDEGSNVMGPVGPATAGTYLVQTRQREEQILAAVKGVTTAPVDVAALAAALAPFVSAGITEAQVVSAVKSVFAEAGS